MNYETLLSLDDNIDFYDKPEVYVFEPEHYITFALINPTIPRKIVFNKEDPGTQVNSSFYPVYDEWFQQCYDPTFRIDVKSMLDVPVRSGRKTFDSSLFRKLSTHIPRNI